MFQRVDPHVEEVVDELDLVGDRKGPFGKVIQKSVTKDIEPKARKRTT